MNKGWNLFKKTGDIKYYLLMKKIEHDFHSGFGAEHKLDIEKKKEKVNGNDRGDRSKSQ